MKKNKIGYITVIIGVLLLGGGLYLLKAVQDPQGIMLSIPYLCIGLGCGIFGHGMGEFIRLRALKNSPELTKQILIDTMDERNITIGCRAKAKAFDMMIFVFGALMISFALMGIELRAVLLLVSAYLFVAGYGVYWRCKYDREM